MEYGQNFTIFGLKMIPNDGEKWSRKNIFEIPSWGSHFLLIHFTSYKGGLFYKITNSVTKMTIFQHGGISKKSLWCM